LTGADWVVWTVAGFIPGGGSGIWGVSGTKSGPIGTCANASRDETSTKAEMHSKTFRNLTMDTPQRRDLKDYRRIVNPI
jgi:hypothetical protein